MSANAGTQGFVPLQSIHIISHGSTGSLLLGSTTFTASNLSSYSKQFATLGNALTENGDILLYGCNVAADQTGLQFINQLADLTNADVAASNDITGSAVLGGDWQLEAATGTIESSLALSTATLDSYSDILATNYATKTGPVIVAVGNGILTTDLGRNDIVESFTLQSDGKILVGTRTALARYNTDGSLDTTFDSDGKVTFTLNKLSDGHGIAVQTDGKILASGWDGDGLARYNTDGSLDTTFNSDGKIGVSISVQSDGKIIVGESDRFALARYNTDGSLDTTFDSDGKVSTDINTDSAYSLGDTATLQPDGKILVVGSSSIRTSSSYGSGYTYKHYVALVRYNVDGSLDTTFDFDGKVIIDFAQSRFSGTGGTVQTDGKILVWGCISSSGNLLVRYNADGSLDTTFGSDGIVAISWGEVDSSVIVQPDGKILVTGYSNNDFLLARYNADGSLDTAFDSDGKVTTDFGGIDLGQHVILQTDGKILVAGSVWDPKDLERENSDVALARYNTDGSLDNSFGPPIDTTGPTITTFSPTDESASAGVSDNIVLTFDEAIQKGKGVIEIVNFTGKTEQIFNIATSKAISISGDTLTINPTKDLSYDTHYFIFFRPEVITDTSNNNLNDPANLLSSYNFKTTDTLTTSASSYTLPKKGANNLTYSGNSDFTGKGNISANVITGSSGNDALNGGLGNDTLTGSAGNDTFVFDTKPNASTNIDSITDFISGSDDIYLSKKLFTAYRKAGVDLTNDFVVDPGTIDVNNDGQYEAVTAQDTSDHFLFNQSTGALYYDADGSGSKAAVQFATLTGIATLAASDLHIY